MNASVEWLDRDRQIGLIRTHPAAGPHTVRSPYTWSVTVAVSTYAPKAAMLKGVYRKPTLSEARAVRTLLRELGVSVVWLDKAGVYKFRLMRVKL